MRREGRSKPAQAAPARLIASVLLTSLALAAAPAADSGPHPALGMRVDDAWLFDLDGRALRLSEVQEPVVVLNLFAFWCDTWIGQLPQLRELATRQEDLRFRLLSISVDGRWTGQLREVCGDDPPPFPVLIDRERALSRCLQVRHVPTVVVLDRSRRARFVYEGYPGNLRVLRAIRAAASRTIEAQ